MSEAISDLCLLCGKDRETVDQLFVHCFFFFFFWCLVGGGWGFIFL